MLPKLKLLIEKISPPVRFEVDISGLTFYDHGKVLRMDVEEASHSRKVYIDPNSTTSWKPPHEDIPITQEDKDRIVQFIVDYYEKDGYECLVEKR